jgi:putative phosphoribosyl transferase
MAERVFTDRDDAGRALAAAVADRLRDRDLRGALVLGLPRGGVPVARQVADTLDAELDIIVARKIGVPWQPELGVGAVTADGPALFDHATLQYLGLRPEQLARAAEQERAEALRRLHRYRGDRPPPTVTDRPVLVIDDGLATGVTARAALRSLREQRPGRLIFAAPVCAPTSAAALTRDADDVICVQQPPSFGAVGAWYTDFPQLTDTDVEQQLTAAHHRARHG